MKAIFKQDEYESELSDKVKAIQFHSETFKDVAEQWAFHTQGQTLSEVKSLKSQGRKRQRMIMQQIAHSRSEANLHHLNTGHLIKAESESITQLRADQERIEELIKSKFDRQETGMNAIIEMRKLVKELLSSNGRIDRRTNDSWCLQILHGPRLMNSSLAAYILGEPTGFRDLCFEE